MGLREAPPRFIAVQQRFLIACGDWTPSVQHVRTVEFWTEVKLVGIVECPLSLPEWEVVSLERPERVWDDYKSDLLPNGHGGSPAKQRGVRRQQQERRKR